MIVWKKPELISFTENEIKQKIVVGACTSNCDKSHPPNRAPRTVITK